RLGRRLEPAPLTPALVALLVARHSRHPAFLCLRRPPRASVSTPAAGGRSGHAFPDGAPSENRWRGKSQWRRSPRRDRRNPLCTIPFARREFLMNTCKIAQFNLALSSVRL